MARVLGQYLRLLNKKPILLIFYYYPAKNFRHQIFHDYKAQRKPLDQELKDQMPIAREAVDALNIVKVEIEGYEADDLIATLSKDNLEAGVETVIVTGDKDILQLVRDEKVLVWNDSKDIMYGEKEVEEKFGIKPEKLTDVFALMGDASDNVPGIKGIGEKTAVKLIKEFGSLAGVLENADKVGGKTGKLLQEGKEDALMSRRLVALSDDIPFKYNLKDFECKPIDDSKTVPFFEKYEFNSLIKQIHKEEDGEEYKNYKPEPELKSEHRSSLPAASGFSEIKKFKPLEKFAFEIISSKQQAENLAGIIKKEKICAVKTVGASIDPLKTNIVGVSFFAASKAYYIPVGHSDFTVLQISFEDFKEIFKSVLADKHIKKIGDDLKYERNIYKSQGLSLEGIYFDTSIASYCINPSVDHELEVLAKQYMDFDAGNADFLGKGAKKINFAESSVENGAKYSGSMVYAAFNIFQNFEKLISERNLSKLFFDIEMPLVEVLSDMEIAGIKVDLDFLRKFNEKTVTEIKKIETKLYDIAGKEFNINSPKQLASIMFEKLNLPVVKKTKTGYSTDEEVLTELSGHEFPAEVLKYREFQKLKSTYIDPVIDYSAYYGGRIHTVFNQTVTATGRLSSSDPNLQNIPIRTAYGREFRKAFIAEKGKIYVSADYSQIDLRVLAHISGDEKLIAAFKHGEDIHSATAREVFEVPKYKEVPSELRSNAKAINFGIVYGMSSFGLSRQLNIPFAKAKAYIDSYFEKYSGVKRWMKEIVDQAKETGAVCTITGRVRFVPELKSSIAPVRQAGERIALNTPVQGSSADIIKIAMLNLHREVKKENYDAQMLLQVHDDLLFEVDEKIVRKFAALLKKEMEGAVELAVPLRVDVKSGRNWGEMKEI